MAISSRLEVAAVTEYAVRPATRADIAELVRLRGLLFGSLAAGAWGAPPDGTQWQAACAAALEELLASGAVHAVVIDSGDGLACCGLAVIDQRLPSPFNPAGRVGYLFGVVTDPACRGQGRARAVMSALLDWLAGQGITRVDLHASPDGEHLYRDLGFRDHPDPTLSRTSDLA